MTKLNEKTLALLRETAEAERMCGSAVHATALELLLKWYEESQNKPSATLVTPAVVASELQMRFDFWMKVVLPELLLAGRLSINDARLLKEVADDVQGRAWRPIETAPPNEWVEVCGNSGYTSFPAFLAVAIKDVQYRPRDPWQDVTMTGLSENGWTPTHWRPRSSFPS